ncbi:hypothetical protein GDO78_007816 [Eleutherodactylus coqui]|uniref:Uncharacterized protein n=1 Tax=Eleutherodactylus coqui TaxID=57060 RepID=A0A8J6FJR9_ELECQ|nr:hypothetical protein GDO78_007816 [Eleutherodactylus coqui]
MSCCSKNITPVTERTVFYTAKVSQGCREPNGVQPDVTRKCIEPISILEHTKDMGRHLGTIPDECCTAFKGRLANSNSSLMR